MSLRILTASDIKNVLSMPDAIMALKEAFSQLAQGRSMMPLRTAIPIPKYRAATFCMPAYMTSSEQLGIKVVSSFPENIEKALPNIHGIVILLDAQTGQPKALLEGSYLTALRTGAVSGLATELLAKPDASNVAIIGSGVQAKTQLEAVLCVRKINRIRLYSRTRAHAECFVQEINHPDLPPIIITDSVHEATIESDIICMATSSTSPILHPADIKPGTHINAVGSHSAQMHEFSSELMLDAIVVVDQRTAALAEAGEIIEGIQKGILKEKDLIELGQLILEPHLGRQNQNQNQITLFKSVGLAIQDVSTAEQAFKAALRMNQGIEVEI